MHPSAQLYFAAAAFLALHFVAATPLRPALVARIGERGYRALYSLAALAALAWMTWAYIAAPAAPLWGGWRGVPALVMPFAFVLIACGMFSRNPTLVSGARLLNRPEPATGITRVTRHPVMWGIMLWAGAHILARGEEKSLVFFGAFLLLAALGTLAMDARLARALGEDWRRFAATSSHVPFFAIAAGRNRFDAREIGWRDPLIGLALYALVLWAHPWMFGAQPF